MFVDLPGYGFAKVPMEIRKRWKPLVEAYLKDRKTLKLVVLILDVRRIPSKEDIQLLLGPDCAPWHMYIVVEDEEKITVPAGTFDTYRIKLEPDYKSIMGKWAWTSSLVKRFVPDYYFWVDKQEPHHLIRFQGTFGPVGGSPPQAHELSEVIPGTSMD